MKTIEEIKELTPEEKYKVLKDLGLDISYEEFLKSEYVNYWNEE